MEPPAREDCGEATSNRMREAGPPRPPLLFASSRSREGFISEEEVERIDFVWFLERTGFFG